MRPAHSHKFEETEEGYSDGLGWHVYQCVGCDKVVARFTHVTDGVQGSETHELDAD